MPNLKKIAGTLTCLATLISAPAYAQLASPHVDITELNGQQVFQGDGGYDQIDYDGHSSDYTFIRNADLSVSVTKPDGVTDRLINIDGFWFSGEQQWYPIEDLAVTVDGGQTIIGSVDTYDQVDYPGHHGDYTFVLNADTSVSVTKPNGEVDTLVHIDGFWFSGEQQWYPLGDLIQESSDDRTITGGSDYDQVDYPGFSSNYTFVENADGSVSVTKPNGGVDTLIRIDGFWFQGEEEWYPIESLISQGDQTIVGTNAYDQVDYDGFRSQYTFIENANGSFTVKRPDGHIDTLTSIDGFWFRDEQAWYSIENIIDGDTPVDDTPVDDTPVDDTPVDNSTGTLINGVITGSNNVNDNLVGDGGNNVFFAGRGVDVVTGLGGQDTLRVDGDVFEWTYAQNGDVITMSHPTWGVNTLTSVERIFSLRAGQDFSTAEAIASTNGLPAFRIDNDDVINGTPGDDDISAPVAVLGFYGGLGNDIYRGTNNFEQVNYDGARAEFTISRNANGSIRIAHPIWGSDTLIDIDGVIFTGAEPGVGGAVTAPFEFVSTDDL